MTVASLPAGRLLLVPWRGSGHMGCPQPLSTVPAVAVDSHCAHWSAVSSLQASASGAVTQTAAGAEPASPRGADGAAGSGASRSAGECSRLNAGRQRQPASSSYRHNQPKPAVGETVLSAGSAECAGGST